MRRLRLTHEAETDIEGIVAWSRARFGDESWRRYAALLAAAIQDIAEDPERVGHQARPELGNRILSWHLRMSRHHLTASTVRRPRHVLIYRIEGDIIEVVRVLHDAMDPVRHVEPDAHASE